MSKTKPSIIKFILLAVCILSLAGGIFSTVEIVQQNKICTENSAVVEGYKEKYETETFKNFVKKQPGAVIFRDSLKKKADEAQKNIDKAENNRVIFIVLAAVLYAAFVICLVFSIKIGKSNKAQRE